MTGFAELHCYSNFSFLKAASHPEELVQQAYALGYAGLAITDECSIAGAVRAWRQLALLKQQNPNQTTSTATNFKLVVGSSFQFNGHEFVVLARNINSYGELCRLITHCRRQADKGEYTFTPSDLKQFIKQGLILWRPSEQQLAGAKKVKSEMDKNGIGGEREIDGEINEEIAQQLAETQLPIGLLLNLELTASDVLRARVCEGLSAQFQWPILATNSALMHHSQRKPLHDVLTAIRLNQSVFDIQPKLLINAERHLRPLPHLSKLYSDAYLSNTLDFLQLCQFDFDQLDYQYPDEVVETGWRTFEYLKRETWRGAHRRYGSVIPKKVKATIKKEFALIKELAYEHYFLTVYDVVQFAKSKRILHQGRGSAANSAVCFCLGITEVDPDKTQLLFERFMNRNRKEPPDIDVDFDNSRREEVIQYLYEKYGRERCAIAATVISYRPKSALRDVGKALGIEPVQLESVISGYGWRYRSEHWIDEIIDARLSKNNQLLQQFKTLLSTILGFPRHLSQHVGGFILSQTPLSEIVPIENASMADRTVIQWDKDDLEAVGLMKIDVLALGMLAALQKALDMVAHIKGKPFELSDIPRDDDPNVYGMLQQADSVGLFQVESRAQMNMLPRLKPSTFYDLVVQVAIVRPGPIHGDMVHPYLKRKHGLEKVDVPLVALKPVLDRTYGVPIFQEQVIALAMVAADFSADEAEELRRSMASWRKRGHMNGLQAKLHQNLTKKGVSEEYVQRISAQIEGFGEYGFPESHAASFALIAYYSAWMKHYYPDVFCCALLNSQPMGFYPPWQLIQDAQRHDVQVLPVDVNQSHWHNRVCEQYSQAIQGDSNTMQRVVQLGFRMVKGLQQSSGERIVERRPPQGYESINQVLVMCQLDKDEINALTSAHGFRCFNQNRYENRWQAYEHDYFTGLFAAQSSDVTLGSQPSRLTELCEDLSATGLTLMDHPMAYMRDEAILEDCLKANELLQQPHESEAYVAGIVTNRQRPKTSAGVTFVTLEDETGSINLVVWLTLAKKQLKALTQSRIMKVYGRIDKDMASGVVHVIAHRIFDISDQLAEYKKPSRDYH